MSNQALPRDHVANFVLASVTLAGAPLGPGTALADEDVLRVLLLDAPTGEKALQMHYDSIIGVAMGDGSVVITCRDGRALVVSTKDASLFRLRVLAACRALPEVTRALRALGSRRGARGTRRSPTDKEARFFAPLIAARRASMETRDAGGVIAAFGARRLAQEIAATILDFAAVKAAGHPARRRALEAELSDATDQLSVALNDLEQLAALAVSDVDDLGRWRAWASAVQHVFEAADRSWVSIEPVLSR
jgi:hypothetical protein